MMTKRCGQLQPGRWPRNLKVGSLERSHISAVVKRPLLLLLIHILLQVILGSSFFEAPGTNFLGHLAHISFRELSNQISALPVANQAIGGVVAQVRKIQDEPVLENPSGN